MLRPAALLALALAGCAPPDGANEAASAAPASAAAAAPAGEAADPAPEANGPRRVLVEVPDRGEASVRADLDLGLGTVTTGLAERGALFQADVTLPVAGLRLRVDTTTAATERGPQARVALGLEGNAASPGDLGRTRGIAWRLLFSPRTPLDLAVTMGAAEADLDLSGIPLRRLAVTCGVARTTLRLARPNPERGADVEIKAGVSAFRGEGLGHLRFRRLRFEGGVGRFALDFRGARPEPGAEATLSVGVGELSVTLPAGVPLAVEAPGGRLSAIELPPGLVTLGQGRYATPGAGPDAFTVRIASGPGRVVVTVE